LEAFNADARVRFEANLNMMGWSGVPEDWRRKSGEDGRG
jgi:hypothetical protein